MRLELSEPELVDDLVGFLRRCEVPADKIGGKAIELDRAHDNDAGGDAMLARIRLDGYLRVWCSMHPGVAVRRQSREAAPRDAA